MMGQRRARNGKFSSRKHVANHIAIYTPLKPLRCVSSPQRAVLVVAAPGG